MKTLWHFFAALAFASLPLHAAPGDLDPLNANLAGGSVSATAMQPDGKIVIGGDFTSVLGVARNNIARLNTDGTLDMQFDPNANRSVSCVAIQNDGKVLIGGRFSFLMPNRTASPFLRAGLARVNADGTLDESFDPNPTMAFDGALYITCLAVQEDGKVMMGGRFGGLQPNKSGQVVGTSFIARVNANGTVDPNFSISTNNNVNCLAVQPDGKIVFGGFFSAPRSHIARVMADGRTLDSFNPNVNETVSCVVVQADGRVLLGGGFSTLNPNGGGLIAIRRNIARVNIDGTLDTTFDPSASSEVATIALQADGKIVIGGYFTALQPNGASASSARSTIARINGDGTLDAGFDPNANTSVVGVALQADGKVLLNGRFTALRPNGAAMFTTRNGFARLQNDTAFQTLFAPDTTQVQWTRGGAAPEVSQVTFELSSDGGTVWTPLGAGVRVSTSPNWQIGGLALPASGILRARGRVTSGTNGGSGLIEQAVAFPLSSSAPAVATGGISGRTENAVLLNGTVNPGSLETTAYFEYGQSAGYGNSTPATPIGDSPSHVNVQAPLAGLTTATLYHFRLVATNALGTTLGSDATFTTAGPAAVTTNGANTVTKTAATLTGTVTPDGIATSASFEYGLTTAYGSSTMAQAVGSGTTPVNVQAIVSGLAANTTYHFRVLSTSAAGTVFGADVAFTTDFDPPIIATLLPNNVTMTEATLNARVNPNAAETTVFFQYGATTDYGNVTSSIGVPAGTGEVDVPTTITDLQPGVRYHYRAAAVNPKGTRFGGDATFTAAGGGTGGGGPTAVPTVATQMARSIGGREATLLGAVNPNGGTTLAYFEYGQTTAYGNQTPPEGVGGGPEALGYTKPITGLQPGTIYHFRLVAANSLGASMGEDVSFTTSFDPPTVQTGAAAASGTFSVLRGTVNPNGGSTTALFEYGRTPALGSSQTVQGILSGNSDLAVEATISGLVAGTVYYFRITAGTAQGDIQSFTTLGAQTPVAVPDAMFITTQSASLNVVANDVNGDTGQVGVGLTFDGIVQQGRFGSAAGGPVVSYIPNASFPLSGDSFQYRIRSAANETAIGTVTVLPFAALDGSYGGTINAGSAGEGADGGSIIPLEMTALGGFTATMRWQGQRYTLRSSFDTAGVSVSTQQKTGAPPGADLVVSLALTAQGIIAGELMDEQTGRVFPFLLRSAAGGNGSAAAGSYTSFIEQPGSPALAAVGANGTADGELGDVEVTGTGFTLSKITDGRKKRKARFIGQVPDGEPFSQGSGVFGDTVPLDASLYPRKKKRKKDFNGFVAGNAVFAGDGSLASVLDWTKLAAAPGLYPQGFRNGLLLRGDLLASVGESPVPTILGLLGSKVRIEFRDGDLSPEDAERIFVADAKIVLQGRRLKVRVDGSELADMKMKISPATGMISGKFRHPNPAVDKPVNFNAIIRRLADPVGKGNFRGPVNAGKVRVFKVE